MPKITMADKMDELMRRVEADDPAALWEYAVLLEEKDPAESFKYTILAAQLGVPQALQRAGDAYFDDDRYEEAAHYYRAGAKAGLIECSVKLAVINLSRNEQKSVNELEELAEMGITSACEALADYYREHGNKRLYAYWHSLAK